MDKNEKLKSEIIRLTKRLAKLQKKFDDFRERSIAWGVDDFIARAEERGYTISKPVAEKCLKEMIRNHDCNYGISWETLDVYIQRDGTEK